MPLRRSSPRLLQFTVLCASNLVDRLIQKLCHEKMAICGSATARPSVPCVRWQLAGRVGCSWALKRPGREPPSRCRSSPAASPIFWNPRRGSVTYSSSDLGARPSNPFCPTSGHSPTPSTAGTSPNAQNLNVNNLHPGRMLLTGRLPTFRRSLPKEIENCECKPIRQRHLRNQPTGGWPGFAGTIFLHQLRIFMSHYGPIRLEASPALPFAPR
jgi:hypothetical protein